MAIDWLGKFEVNGGRVSSGDICRLELPPTASGYADAQLDDYSQEGGKRQDRFRWHQGVELKLKACFSHQQDDLVGTAGFGFWNAPFGDPSVRRPALPQAAWFFFASEPSDLPLAEVGPGRGWFASSIDASSAAAKALIPAAPAALLLNQFGPLRRRLWPRIRAALGISFARVNVELRRWHSYRLLWQPSGCLFQVNGQDLLRTRHSPAGPLGFVCWIDNQYLVATNRGRFRWGVLPTASAQWMEISELSVEPIGSG